MVGGEAADDRSSSSSSEAVVGKNAIEDIKAPNAFRKDGEPDYKPKKVTWSSLPIHFWCRFDPHDLTFLANLSNPSYLQGVKSVSSVCRPGLV